MSDPRRILDRQSEASALARDLVGSAREDQPSASAKARAKAQLERTLGGDGITTHISSLSAAMADLKLSAPVLAPTPVAAVPATESAARKPSRAWGLYASIAAAGIIAAGSVGVAWVLRTSSPQNAAVQQSAPPPAAPTTTATPTPSPTPAPVAPAAGTTVANNAETPGAAAAGGGGAEPGHERSGSGSSGSRGARERPTGSSGGGGGGSAATASNAGGGGGGGGSCAQRCHGDIDCLLRCGTASPAGGGGGSHPASGGGGGGGAAAGGPEAPSRGDVMGAMSRIRGAVQGCGQGMTGTATVSITFASSGRVSTANVASPFAGTPTGSCIARAVRSASVPPFTRPTFTVNYPFVIH